MHGSTTSFHVRGHFSNIMKNFVRLVQFAWRYKLRFGLSVACAAMVALLSFTEIGAVYPLLHILFGSQNPQRWISEKIVGLEVEVLSLDNRANEVAHVLENLQSGQPRHEQLKKRYLEVQGDLQKKEGRLRTYERTVDVAGLKERTDPDGRDEIVLHENLRRDYRLAEAQCKELQEALALFRKRDSKSLQIRLREISASKATKRSFSVAAAGHNRTLQYICPVKASRRLSY